MNLREFAKGKDCQVRIPGVCSFNPEETVLAHIRRGGVGGMGSKPADIIGVHSCARCHDVLDSRVPYPKEHLDTYILEALCRTLAVVARGKR